ncbi:MAG: class I SAM-dependent methyltransferase, partial [Parafilimonas sp.]
ITADKAPGFYRLVDKNIMYADATALPFKNEAFDIVIANHIMEHIPEDLKAMKEICRVLKQGGRAIMQIPFSNSLTETIEEPFICDAKKQSQLFGQKRSCAYL